MTTTDDTPVTEHDARCPEITDPQIEPNPDRCICRDDHGHTPREQSTSWADGPLCPFDLETTGQDPLEARIVTGTVIRVRPGLKAVTTNWLSDVDGMEIPDAAAEIHGVTTERARAEGRPHRDVVGEIVTAIALDWKAGIPVVGHNVSYDLTVLAAECARLDLGPFTVAGPVIDTIVLDRGVDKWRKGSRKLIDTARHYGIVLTEEEAHGSEADALAAARIAWKIARKHPKVGAMSLTALMRWQAEKHHAWAENFGDYLTRQGKTDDVSREWPMRAVA